MSNLYHTQNKKTLQKVFSRKALVLTGSLFRGYIEHVCLYDGYIKHIICENCEKLYMVDPDQFNYLYYKSDQCFLASCNIAWCVVGNI